MWPLRRSRAMAVPPVTATQTSPGWDTLPALQRVTPTIEPLLNPAAFEASLVAWRAPARFLEPLGHRVTSTGPAGIVAGLVRPVVQRATGPAMPLASPARRRPAAAHRPRWWWPSATISHEASPEPADIGPADAEPVNAEPMHSKAAALEPEAEFAPSRLPSIETPIRTLSSADPVPSPVTLSRVAQPPPLPVVHLPPITSTVERATATYPTVVPGEEPPLIAPLAGSAEPLAVPPPESGTSNGTVVDSPGHHPPTIPPVQRSPAMTPAPGPAPLPGAPGGVVKAPGEQPPADRPRRLGLGAPLPPADRPRVQRSAVTADPAPELPPPDADAPVTALVGERPFVPDQPEPSSQTSGTGDETVQRVGRLPTDQGAAREVGLPALSLQHSSATLPAASGALPMAQPRRGLPNAPEVQRSVIDADPAPAAEPIATVRPAHASAEAGEQDQGGGPVAALVGQRPLPGTLDQPEPSAERLAVQDAAGQVGVPVRPLQRSSMGLPAVSPRPPLVHMTPPEPELVQPVGTPGLPAARPDEMPDVPRSAVSADPAPELQHPDADAPVAALVGAHPLIITPTPSGPSGESDDPADQRGQPPARPAEWTGTGATGASVSPVTSLQRSSANPPAALPHPIIQPAPALQPLPVAPAQHAVVPMLTGMLEPVAPTPLFTHQEGSPARRWRSLPTALPVQRSVVATPASPLPAVASASSSLRPAAASSSSEQRWWPAETVETYRAALATGLAVPDGDGGVVFAPPPAPASHQPPVYEQPAVQVQRAEAAPAPESPPAPATAEPTAGGAPAPASAVTSSKASSKELDELAKRLYPRISRHLKQEWRLSRERVGLSTDLPA
jgi:hypothetical protein